ncbi:MAG: hypothetical protein ACRDBJ_02115 [Plesiomonas shigelloides]
MVKPVPHHIVRAKALASPKAKAAYDEAMLEYDRELALYEQQEKEREKDKPKADQE